MKTIIKLSAILSLTLSALAGSASAALAAPPTNDDFDAATVIAAIPFTDTLDMTEATSASDDPQPSCDDTSRTAWYTFTPSEDMRLKADTFGSNYDTTLSVWTGERGALIEIACNDDFASLQSRVDFGAQAGVTYYFMAGSFHDDAGGQLVFNLVLPPAQLGVDVLIDPVGYIKPSTGVLMISGVVECSRQAEVRYFVETEQRVGRFVIRGFSADSIENCEGVTPWITPAISDNGSKFVGGKVNVTVIAIAISEDGELVAGGDFRTVDLRGSPGVP